MAIRPTFSPASGDEMGLPTGMGRQLRIHETPCREPLGNRRGARSQPRSRAKWLADGPKAALHSVPCLTTNRRNMLWHVESARHVPASDGENSGIGYNMRWLSEQPPKPGNFADLTYLTVFPAGVIARARSARSNPPKRVLEIASPPPGARNDPSQVVWSKWLTKVSGSQSQTRSRRPPGGVDWVNPNSYLTLPIPVGANSP